MSQNISNEVKFKTNTIDFLDFCMETAIDLNETHKLGIDTERISTQKELVTLLQGADILKKFIGGTYSYWEQIRLKNIDFFDKNSSSIFGNDVKNGDLSVLRHIFMGSNDDELKDIVWNYLHSFIKISLRYVNEKRGINVEIIKEEGKSKKKISWKNGQEFKGVDLVGNAKKWGIELYDGFLKKD
jgi:uncharacterized protein related to proFAR isomerase